MMKLKTIESLQKNVRKKNTNKRVQGKNYKKKKMRINTQIYSIKGDCPKILNGRHKS